MVEIEDAGGCLLKQFPCAVPEEFVDTDLDFKCRITVLLVEF